MDEASKLLTKEDGESLKNEQAKQMEQQERTADFIREYQERGRIAREKNAVPQAKKRCKKDPPRKMHPADELDHEHAKGLLPPGAYIWRAFSSHSWQARLPPFPTVSRGWARACGSGEALRPVLV